MIAGRITDLSRIFGFNWVIEWEDWSGPKVYSNPVDATEVSFVCLDTSINGGEYFVYHEALEGGWFAYEQGGHGPHIWDRDIGDGFESPLAAMLACRKDYEANRIKMEEQEREIEAFLEQERLRARAYEKIHGVG